MRLSNELIPNIFDGYNGHPLTENCTLTAKDDREAIFAWLAKCDQKNTYASYSKEVDRFYRWMHQVKGKAISETRHEDFNEYRAFLSNPSEDWISKTKYPRTNENWKPFSGPLMDSSIKQTILILDAFFSWLVEVGYLHGNPISVSSKRNGRNKKKRLERYVKYASIAEFHNLLDEISNQDFSKLTKTGDIGRTSGKIKKLFQPGSQTLARSRWIFSALFLTGMRISEMAKATSNNIHSNTEDGITYSWITIVGKGDVERSIPLTSDFLNEYMRYKESITKDIQNQKSLPLVFSIQENKMIAPLSRSTLHRIIKLTSDLIVMYLTHIQRNEEAEKMKHLSAHWLRHSYASALADTGADQRTIKENLGHASLQSTSIYMHKDDLIRHRESQQIRIAF